jgi:hypothetical protein
MSEDMTAPVTRGELKEELAEFRAEFRAELQEGLAKFRVEISQDVSRHMKAGFEDMRQLFGVLDDKQLAQNDQHASLARRVDRLEVAVFDPPNPKP